MINKRFEVLYYRAYKRAYGVNFVSFGHLSHKDVVSMYNLLPCDVYVKRLRLRYFVRFLNHAPLTLKFSVSSEFIFDEVGSSWLAVVRDDLLWLTGYVSLFRSFGDPGISCSMWHD